MDYIGPERRRSPRIPITARARKLKSSKVEYMFVRDISMSGVGLISNNPLGLHETISFEIAIGGIEKFIKVIGEVVRKIENVPGGYGVRFVRFMPHSKSRLSKALSNLVVSD